METPRQPADDLQDTVELDVEAIFRACDEAASQEAAQAERPLGGIPREPFVIREVIGSGRRYYIDNLGQEIVVRLDKWS